MPKPSKAEPFYDGAPTAGQWVLSHITMLTTEQMWACGNGVMGGEWGKDDAMQFLWLHWRHKTWQLKLGKLYLRAWRWYVSRQIDKIGLVKISEDICRMVDSAWALRLLPTADDDETSRPLDTAWVARMTIMIAASTGWSEDHIQSLPLAKVFQYQRSIIVEKTGKQQMTAEEVAGMKSVKDAVKSGDKDAIQKWLRGEE